MASNISLENSFMIELGGLHPKMLTARQFVPYDVLHEESGVTDVVAKEKDD